MARKKTKGKRTSQKHPNSFPSSGKGRVAVFDEPAILAMYSLFEVTHDFVIGRRPGARLNWMAPCSVAPGAKQYNLEIPDPAV